MVIFLLGVVSLLLFDNDQSAPPVEHRILLLHVCAICMLVILFLCSLVSHLDSAPAEGPHRSMVAHILYQLLSFLGVPDHRVRVTTCTLFLQ